MTLPLGEHKPLEVMWIMGYSFLGPLHLAQDPLNSKYN